MKQLQLLAFHNVIESLQQEIVSYIYWPQKWVTILKNTEENLKLKSKLYIRHK